MRIGVISDTHDFLDPRIPKLFAGVNHILHGGDIGMPVILLELEQIGPVTAVGGNTDDGTFRYPETSVIELGGRKFLIHHIVNPHKPDDRVQARMTRERPALVIFGHTHKPFFETINRTIFFNPGYAGKPRFGMERSVAILHCDENEIRPEYLTL